MAHRVQVDISTGRRDAATRVFCVFLAQKLERASPVVGDGTQTRDFVHVTVVAAAFVRAAESDVCGEAMNVGAGAEHSVNEIADLLGAAKVHTPKRPGA